MKLRWDNQHVRWGVTSFLVIAASMLFYYGVFHMKTLITGIQTFLGILTPIVYGVVIAFLLTPVLNFLEKKIIYPLLARKEVSVGKKGRKAIRWACVILCMFLFLALIYALIMMILPELIRSIMGLIYSFPAYVKVIQKWLQSFIEKWNLNSDALDTLNQSITTAQDYLTTNILPQMQEMLKNISAGVFELINFLKNFLIGAIVSLDSLPRQKCSPTQFLIPSMRILSSIPCVLPIKPLSDFSVVRFWILPSLAYCAILV